VDVWNSLPPTRALFLSDARSRSSVGGVYLPYSLAVTSAGHHPTRPLSSGIFRCRSHRSRTCRCSARRAVRARCSRCPRRLCRLQRALRLSPSPLSLRFASLRSLTSSHPTSSHPTSLRSMSVVAAVGARAKAIPGYFQSVSSVCPILWVRRRCAGCGCWMCVRQARPNLFGCGSGSPASRCRVFYQLVQRRLVV